MAAVDHSGTLLEWRLFILLRAPVLLLLSASLGGWLGGVHA